LRFNSVFNIISAKDEAISTAYFITIMPSGILNLFRVSFSLDRFFTRI